MRVESSRGLGLHLVGQSPLVLKDAPALEHVAYLGSDHPGMRVEVLIEKGQRVAIGTPLCRDRRRHEIVFCASAAGIVTEIAIGAKRHVAAIVIERDGEDSLEFKAGDDGNAHAIRSLMLQSGLWPSLRTRPFDRVPDPDATPDAIFVTAIDTAPQAPDPALILADRVEDFERGVAALERLTEGPVFVCQSAPEPLVKEQRRLVPVRFVGPHPAGLVGTHVTRLFPLRDARHVWHVNYQDVASLGALIGTGRPDTLRTISLGGPGLQEPVLMRVPLGADLIELVHGGLKPGNKRIHSGSILSGRERRYLSRYDLQASVLAQAPAKPRNWMVSALIKVGRTPPFIPTQALEQVLGADLPVVPLLRALSIGDVETAQRLGCLHLGEDDVALASYVTGHVTDFGACLRSALDVLEQGA